MNSIDQRIKEQTLSIKQAHLRMRKKKKVSTRPPSDISIDENGNGYFTALTVQAYLYQIFKNVFAPTDEQVRQLLDPRIEDWANARDDDKVQGKKPTWKEVTEELLGPRKVDIEKCYDYSISRLREEIGPYLDEALRKLADDIAKETIGVLTPQIATEVEGGINNRLLEVLMENQIPNRWRLGIQDPSRPKGSGYFKGKEDFISALKDVLAAFKGKPSQPRVLLKLSRHSLYQGKSLTLTESQNRTKTLRNWLNEYGLTWDEALKTYFNPK